MCALKPANRLKMKCVINNNIYNNNKKNMKEEI